MTLGSLFLVFEGPGKRLEFRWIFKDSLGTPGSEATHPVEGLTLIPGGTQQPDCKLQGYKTTKLQDYKITGLQA